MVGGGVAGQMAMPAKIKERKKGKREVGSGHGIYTRDGGPLARKSPKPYLFSAKPQQTHNTTRALRAPRRKKKFWASRTLDLLEFNVPTTVERLGGP